MAIPIQFLARFAIPLAVSLLLLKGKDPEQTSIYDTVLEASDKTLSIAKGEGEGPTEYFDYVIIGAGSAGAVVANRLSASGESSVLILEAGGDPNPVSEIPYAADSLTQSDMMLLYTSVPSEKACVAVTGGICMFPRGRALGGSTSVNGLVYNRCQAKDYDSWANFTQDPIWAFSSVVDAFRAVEEYHGFYEDSPGPNHGTNGEINIDKIEYLPGVETLLEAFNEQGIPVGDINSGEMAYGFSKLEYNIKDGLRHSVYHGFIEPLLNRPNVKIYRYSWATKIHLNPAKQAVGVTYERHGQTRYVGVNKEVILAAGAIDSPKLLMLSGIGPAQHLAQYGIEIVVDLPAVGTYLQEHVSVTLQRFSLNKSFGIVDPFTPKNIDEYVTNGTGPLLGLPLGGFIPHLARGYISSKKNNDQTWPDIHIYINEQLVAREGLEPEETIFTEFELGRTEQVGTLRLASADPKEKPLIDPRFFEDFPEDYDRLIDAIEFMNDFFLNSAVYQTLGIRWSDTATPVEECKQFQFATRDYWKCYIQMYSGTGYHPTSTCRMGPNNSVAVVDSKLRVFGTTGLRVIDSSVIPFVPTGNTNFPAIMVGEMGARILLNQI